MEEKRGRLFFYFIAIFLVSIILFIFFETSYFGKIDVAVSNFVPNLWPSGALNSFMILFSEYLITYLLLICSIFILAYFLYTHKTAKAILFAGTMVGGLVLVNLIKLIVHKARPMNSLISDSTFSFPSSHVTISLIFFLLVLYLFRDRIKNRLLRALFVVVSILLILLTAFSRIFLNIHWLSDVLGGFVLGLAVFFCSILIFKTLIKKKKG